MTRRFEALWKTEDWWAVWLGLGIVLLALGIFLAGGSIQAWAVTPGTWSTFSGLAADLVGHLTGYVIVFLLFGVVFTLSMAVMGRSISEYVPGYVILFVGSLATMYLSSWTVARRYDLGAPLLALVAGLIVGNLVKMPDWFKTSLRTEYYIKTGIVLLGATLPLTLIASAGPIAFLQATIVSVSTWLTIYLAATRLFRLEPQFGAVLGAGGAVCGVSASIAVGGAVKAKKDHIAISIAVVSVWAVVMILALTTVLKFLVPEAITPGEAGAWVGTSEFADAAGFAVVAEIANRHGDSAINTFTLMKVIGRDIWIGIWCLILSVVSVTLWERGESDSGRRPGAGIVWQRFPKFVIGFFAASIVMSLVAAAGPEDHVGRASTSGTFKSKDETIAYSADFSDFRAPAAVTGRFGFDAQAGEITFRGELSPAEYAALRGAVDPADPNREHKLAAFKQLQHAADWFQSALTPGLISPVKKLRSWAFVLCFLGIGLSTRFAELATFGLRPFWAFTIGVLVNVPLGWVLSTIVFSDYWARI